MLSGAIVLKKERVEKGCLVVDVIEQDDKISSAFYFGTHRIAYRLARNDSILILPLIGEWRRVKCYPRNNDAIKTRLVLRIAPSRESPS